MTQTPEFPRDDVPREETASAHLIETLTPEQFKELFERLVLMRHGETAWNKENRLQGSGRVDGLDNDQSLSPDGVSKVMEGSQALGKKHKIGAVITSELKRAKETANIYAEAMAVSPNNRFQTADLNEYNFGKWEGKYIKKDLLTDAEHEEWKKGRLKAEIALKGETPHQGEKFVPFLQRVNEVLQRMYYLLLKSEEFLTDPELKVLVVTHNDVLRAVRFLYILSKETGGRISQQAILNHEYRFLFKQQGGDDVVSFPHGPFKIDLETTEVNTL